jgi:ribulose-phosphate 3-epimerase
LKLRGDINVIQIAPSILSADFSRLGEQVRLVEDAGAEVLHIDVMDGHFVPNLTFGPALVKSIRANSSMRFDVHLMVEEPERYIVDFAGAGADHITFHLESTLHVHRVIQQIKEQGITAGIALNPATPLDGIKYILEDLDMVLLMTVNPGFGGQKFIPNVIPKIQVLHRHLEQMQSSCQIEVDGGINLETISAAVRAGAHILVAGAAVFAQADPKLAVEKLRQAAGFMKGE